MEQDRNLRDDAMPLSARILTYGAFAVATFALMFCMAHAAPAQIALPSGSDPIVHTAFERGSQGNIISTPGVNAPTTTDALAHRLGIEKGQMELFERPIEDAPAADTDMRAVIDARGIKLKITW